MPIFTGVHKQYEWLETEHRLKEVVALCPQIVLGRYFAVTAVDSGEFRLSEANVSAGWKSAGRIAYSPLVESIAAVPEDCCGRACGPFDEWYVYETPTQQGSLCMDNPFTTEMAPPNVFAFVNLGEFCPSNPEMQPITELFWKQIEWMQPQSYIADGNACLVFASRDKSLFAGVLDTLEKYPSKESEP